MIVRIDETPSLVDGYVSLLPEAPSGSGQSVCRQSKDAPNSASQHVIDFRAEAVSSQPSAAAEAENSVFMSGTTAILVKNSRVADDNVDVVSAPDCEANRPFEQRTHSVIAETSNDVTIKLPASVLKTVTKAWLLKLCSYLSSEDAHCVESFTQFFSQFYEYSSSSARLPETTLTNDFNITQSKNRFMSFVAGWLGHEFRLLQPAVLAKTEQFKRRHLSTIDSLPPPSELIADIFPQCMILLLTHWMCEGHGDDGANKKAFPFIQIILEFANSCLVSGVSHVVYPRLLQEAH